MGAPRPAPLSISGQGNAPSVRNGTGVGAAAPDATTLAALKQGLISYHLGADLDKLDPVGREQLKAWASNDPQAIITWLSDVTENGRNHQHALDGMVNLLLDDSPQSALVLAESIGDPGDRDTRVSTALMGLAMQDPSAAASALDTAGLSDPGLRANTMGVIRTFQSGNVTDGQRLKLRDNLHRM